MSEMKMVFDSSKKKKYQFVAIFHVPIVIKTIHSLRYSAAANEKG